MQIKTLLSSLIIFTFFAFSALAQESNLAVDSSIAYSFPVKYEIADIEVEGKGLDKGLILALIGFSKGQKISIPGEEITNAIQNLWKQGYFSDVKINLIKTEENKAWLKVSLMQRPKLVSFKFNGVTKNQAKKLKEQIKISAGAIVTEQLISNSVYNIKQYYLGKGYPNSVVEVSRVQDSTTKGNTTKLVFDVNRGNRVKIKEILFDGISTDPTTGKKIVSNGKLRRMMKFTKRQSIVSIFKPSKLIPTDYEEDKQKIVFFYQAKGFKDARILRDSIYNINDKYIGIKITIDEGKKYYFRNISWTGNTKYTTEQLDNILNVKKGDIFNPAILESRLSINQAGLDVTSLYMDDGYLFFNLTPVEVSIDDDSVDLEIRIFEGPQATINKVTVTGNTKTHDHVILRELRTKPGQKFSRSDIIRSQRELSQLGYFNPEKMNVVPVPNMQDGTVDIEYTVEEKPNDQIELSGGWGAGRLVGVLGLSLNNFSARKMFKPKEWNGYPSGDGQRFSIRATSNGIFFQQYNMSFTEPWFGGKRPNSFSVTPFYSVQTNGLSVGNPQRYSLNIAGLTVGLGRRLQIPDDYFVLNNQFSYQYYTYKNYPLIGDYSNGYSTNLFFRHTLTHSTINGLDGNFIYPNQGSNISATLQWTPPYSSFNGKDYDKLSPQDRYKFIEYHKWKFDASYFLGIGPKKKLVLMAQSNFGLIGAYNSYAGLSPFERFYIGGDGLMGFSIDGRELIRLRGYNNADALTPRYADGKAESGATIYNKFTFEMRYPFTTSQAATIYGLAFLEGGTATNRFKYYNPYDLKKSVGVGIRLFLPMFGLLGFDYGYGLDPVLPGAPSKNGWNFHLFIGQQQF